MNSKANSAPADGSEAVHGFKGATALGFLVPFLLLVAVLAIVAEGRRTQGLRDTVERSVALRSEVQQLFSAVQDLQLGQRGYILTGNPRFLEPYEQARQNIPGLLTRLAKELGREADQRERLTQLRGLIDHQIEYTSRTVHLVQQGREGDALVAVRSGEGKVTMDAIRRLVRSIQVSEQQRLDAQRRAAEQATARTEMLTAILLAGQIVLLAIAFFLIRRAVAERTRFARRQIDASARQRAILTHASDGIITLNPSGSIETMNPAAQAMLGVTEADAKGLDISRFLKVANDEGGSFLDRLALGDAGQRQVEVEATRADGTGLRADVSIGLLPLPSGRHVILAVRDASERQRVERLKSDFISTVSHELRTPLTSIAGSLGLLTGGAAGTMPDKARRLLDIAYNNSQRLVRLINDILDIEKMVAGQIEFKMEVIDLRAVAEHALVGLQGLAGQHGVTLSLSSGPSPLVRGDADRLTQVIVNLVSNAIKFSPSGARVELSVDITGRRARLQVADHGPGIPEAFRDRIFTRFAQAAAIDTREREGTGLGLAIAKEITERHDGVISFETSPAGTTFTVELPALSAATNADTAINEQLVLICEDDADVAQVLSTMLAGLGFSTSIAPTIAAARESLAATRFAALVLDIHLPDGNGLDFLNELRSSAQHAELPVVVVSGTPSPEATTEIAMLGLIDWIRKPVDPHRLEHALGLAVGSSCRGDCRVLHVDDDQDIREVVASALGGLGEVVEASTLSAARQLLETQKFDAVILDLDLPDGDGLELLPFASAGGRLLPVIIFSAKEMPPVDQLKGVPGLTKSKSSLDALAAMVSKGVGMAQQGETRKAR